MNNKENSADQFRAHYKNWFRVMRYERSDEIPQEIITGDMDTVGYKCRKNWFYGLKNRCEEIVEETDLVSPEEIPDFVQNFLTYVSSDDFFNKERTTREDIEMGNRVAEYFLEIL